MGAGREGQEAGSYVLQSKLDPWQPGLALEDVGQAGHWGGAGLPPGAQGRFRSSPHLLNGKEKECLPRPAKAFPSFHVLLRGRQESRVGLTSHSCPILMRTEHGGVHLTLIWG